MSAFIDEVEIVLKAGDGGNGAVTFRREKHVPRGGPDGGDGGRGGSILFETSLHLATLLDYRPNKIYKAERGADGGAKRMFGKNGHDLILKVPEGTQARDAETGELLADLGTHPQQALVAHGGRGGRGNVHFTSSVQQAPKFGEQGEPGEEFRVTLELKLLADVGLLGFPNVGKSTLLSRMSAAKPKIADYPFTTLVPNLGVVTVADNHQFVMADIPGLIENAHEGAGLGIQFLKHLERTRLLVHLIEVSETTGRDPKQDYDTIRRELAAFSEDLAALPEIIALSKVDAAPDPESVATLQSYFAAKSSEPVFLISAVTGEGIEQLLYHLHQRLLELPKTAPGTDSETLRITLDSGRADDDPRQFSIGRDTDGALKVAGRGIERMVAMTDMNNEWAVRRLQRRLERVGVFRELKTAGAQQGDTVRIRDAEFDYIDEDAEDAESE